MIKTLIISSNHFYSFRAISFFVTFLILWNPSTAQTTSYTDGFITQDAGRKRDFTIFSSTGGNTGSHFKMCPNDFDPGGSTLTSGEVLITAGYNSNSATGAFSIANRDGSASGAYRIDLQLLKNGNLGIGLGTGVAATEKLHVQGSIRATNAILYSDDLNSALSANTRWNGTNEAKLVKGFSSQWVLNTGSGENGDAYFRNSASGEAGTTNNFIERLRIKNNGQIKIGDKQAIGTHGDYKLSVDGKIIAKSIAVTIDNTTNWADFVFKKEYNLTPLLEVEKYIKKEGHLKGIPTTEEVVENGIDLTKMNARLLEKVEELTLYMIEMKKENDKMKKDIEALKTINK